MSDPLVQLLRDRLRAREAARFRARHGARAAPAAPASQQSTLLDVGESTAPRAKTGTIHGLMVALGWTRIDPRPWGKCQARWVHTSGWQLSHCGHPTANYPWALNAPSGAYVWSGAVNGDASLGGGWTDLRTAGAFVFEVLAGTRTFREPEAEPAPGAPAARSPRGRRPRPRAPASR